MPPIFFPPLPLKKTQIQLHSLKTKTLTINLSLFNIISVHFHRFGLPFNKGLYSSPVRQRSVIEFLTAEGEMPIRIHERLKNVYGDATLYVSTVRRWVRRCKESEGQTRLADETRSCRPAIAMTPGNIQRVDDIVRGDRRVKTDDSCRILSFSKSSVITIIHQMGYRKVCARWVPRMLDDQNTEPPNTFSSFN